MKFVIATSKLQELLSTLQNITPQRPATPLLSNLLIEAANDELIITATDLTVGMRCFCEAKILQEGATTVPAKRFSQLIRELTSEQLEISTGENEITEIIAGSSKFKVHGMSCKEYPSLPDLEDATEIPITQSALRDVLFRTSFAVSREDNRYVLTGVFMKIEHGKATFIGTDGKKLARTQLEAHLDASLNGEYIIPLKAVEEILKNLDDKGDATLYLMKDKIAVSANDSILITKLLSGEYPDVNRVIPERQQHHLSLHREELISLLRQISLFAPEGTKPVRFSFANGELKLAAQDIDVGEGRVSMPVNYDGELLEVAYNPGFLLEILRHSKQETIHMGITDAFNPGTITEGDNNNTPLTKEMNPLFIIMPMRLEKSAAAE